MRATTSSNASDGGNSSPAAGAGAGSGQAVACAGSADVSSLSGGIGDAPAVTTARTAASSALLRADPPAPARPALRGGAACGGRGAAEAATAVRAGDREGAVSDAADGGGESAIVRWLDGSMARWRDHGLQGSRAPPSIRDVQRGAPTPRAPGRERTTRPPMSMGALAWHPWACADGTASWMRSAIGHGDAMSMPWLVATYSTLAAAGRHQPIAPCPSGGGRRPGGAMGRAGTARGLAIGGSAVRVAEPATARTSLHTGPAGPSVRRRGGARSVPIRSPFRRLHRSSAVGHRLLIPAIHHVLGWITRPPPVVRHLATATSWEPLPIAALLPPPPSSPVGGACPIAPPHRPSRSRAIHGTPERRGRTPAGVTASRTATTPERVGRPPRGPPGASPIAHRTVSSSPSQRSVLTPVSWTRFGNRPSATSPAVGARSAAMFPRAGVAPRNTGTAAPPTAATATTTARSTKSLRHAIDPARLARALSPGVPAAAHAAVSPRGLTAPRPGGRSAASATALAPPPLPLPTRPRPWPAAAAAAAATADDDLDDTHAAIAAAADPAPPDGRFGMDGGDGPTPARRRTADGVRAAEAVRTQNAVRAFVRASEQTQQVRSAQTDAILAKVAYQVAQLDGHRHALASPLRAPVPAAAAADHRHVSIHDTRHGGVRERSPRRESAEPARDAYQRQQMGQLEQIKEATRALQERIERLKRDTRRDRSFEAAAAAAAAATVDVTAAMSLSPTRPPRPLSAFVGGVTARRALSPTRPGRAERSQAPRAQSAGARLTTAAPTARDRHAAAADASPRTAAPAATSPLVPMVATREHRRSSIVMDDVLRRRAREVEGAPAATAPSPSSAPLTAATLRPARPSRTPLRIDTKPQPSAAPATSPRVASAAADLIQAREAVGRLGQTSRSATSRRFAAPPVDEMAMYHVIQRKYGRAEPVAGAAPASDRDRDRSGAGAMPVRTLRPEADDRPSRRAVPFAPSPPPPAINAALAAQLNAILAIRPDDLTPRTRVTASAAAAMDEAASPLPLARRRAGASALSSGRSSARSSARVSAVSSAVSSPTRLAPSASTSRGPSPERSEPGHPIVSPSPPSPPPPASTPPSAVTPAALPLSTLTSTTSLLEQAQAVELALDAQMAALQAKERTMAEAITRRVLAKQQGIARLARRLEHAEAALAPPRPAGLPVRPTTPEVAVAPRRRITSSDPRADASFATELSLESVQLSFDVNATLDHDDDHDGDDGDDAVARAHADALRNHVRALKAAIDERHTMIKALRPLRQRMTEARLQSAIERMDRHLAKQDREIERLHRASTSRVASSEGTPSRGTPSRGTPRIRSHDDFDGASDRAADASIPPLTRSARVSRPSSEPPSQTSRRSSVSATAGAESPSMTAAPSTAASTPSPIVTERQRSSRSSVAVPAAASTTVSMTVSEAADDATPTAASDTGRRRSAPASSSSSLALTSDPSAAWPDEAPPTHGAVSSTPRTHVMPRFASEDADDNNDVDDDGALPDLDGMDAPSLLLEDGPPGLSPILASHARSATSTAPPTPPPVDYDAAAATATVSGDSEPVAAVTDAPNLTEHELLYQETTEISLGSVTPHAVRPSVRPTEPAAAAVPHAHSALGLGLVDQLASVFDDTPSWDEAAIEAAERAAEHAEATLAAMAVPPPAAAPSAPPIADPVSAKSMASPLHDAGSSRHVADAVAATRTDHGQDADAVSHEMAAAVRDAARLAHQRDGVPPPPPPPPPPIQMRDEVPRNKTPPPPAEDSKRVARDLTPPPPPSLPTPRVASWHADADARSDLTSGHASPRDSDSDGSRSSSDVADASRDGRVASIDRGPSTLAMVTSWHGSSRFSDAVSSDGASSAPSSVAASDLPRSSSGSGASVDLPGRLAMIDDGPEHPLRDDELAAAAAGIPPPPPAVAPSAPLADLDDLANQRSVAPSDVSPAGSFREASIDGRDTWTPGTATPPSDPAVVSPPRAFPPPPSTPPPPPPPLERSSSQQDLGASDLESLLASERSAAAPDSAATDDVSAAFSLGEVRVVPPDHADAASGTARDAAMNAGTDDGSLVDAGVGTVTPPAAAADADVEAEADDDGEVPPPPPTGDPYPDPMALALQFVEAHLVSAASQDEQQRYGGLITAPVLDPAVRLQRRSAAGVRPEAMQHYDQLVLDLAQDAVRTVFEPHTRYYAPASACHMLLHREHTLPPPPLSVEAVLAGVRRVLEPTVSYLETHGQNLDDMLIADVKQNARKWLDTMAVQAQLFDRVAADLWDDLLMDTVASLAPITPPGDSASRHVAAPSAYRPVASDATP
ncbi:hypothetical protein CXG81DRAFT_17868 [Caulochytrium protostelioides]|uniref:Uncharacterized protein n=1 Tax=Caulochytrium protostelioides TaxID=1555241 RepID=A0A4P9XAV5_9FUNG|nr:hypothetical protein CXG81DRAFT_17868 [Caulochytrium protostelioides]|eukprot:RKP02508.1 hypothetical protein CXG81DRAFT_17868 [Caulochytrium protostelioides]